MKKTWGIPTQKAMILIVIVFFLVCTYALPAKSLGQTTVISSTITVGNNPNGVIYDSAKGEIFVGTCNRMCRVLSVGFSL